MKKLSIFVVSIVLITLTACSSEKNLSKDYSQLIEKTKNDLFPVVELDDSATAFDYSENILSDDSIKYTKSSWNVSSADSMTAFGILCRDSDIVIVDNNNDCLVVSDYNGSQIKTVGSTGNGPLEFINPTGICEYESNIYVIDSGNQRVQILNKELNYIDEIPVVNDTNSGLDYESIAVGSDDSIYLFSGSLLSRTIDKWKDGEITRIVENFYGPLYGTAGEIYAINRGLIAVDPKELAITTIPARNSLYHVVDDHLEEVCKLPDNLAINAFIVQGEHIICSSNKLSKLFVFDLNGNYVETIASFNDVDTELGILNYFSTYDNSEYFYTIPASSKIYRISK